MSIFSRGISMPIQAKLCALMVIALQICGCGAGSHHATAPATAPAPSSVALAIKAQTGSSSAAAVELTRFPNALSLWLNRPCAVRDTAGGITLIGMVDRKRMEVTVGVCSATRNAVVTIDTLVGSTPDDHLAPAIARIPVGPLAGRYLVVYGQHSGPSWYRLLEIGSDLTPVLSPRFNLEDRPSTYMQLITGPSAIIAVFNRDLPGKRSICSRRFDYMAQTWDDAVTAVEAEADTYPYFIASSRASGQMTMAFTLHRNAHVHRNREIFWMLSRDDGRLWEGLDGRLVAPSGPFPVIRTAQSELRLLDADSTWTPSVAYAAKIGAEYQVSLLSLSLARGEWTNTTLGDQAATESDYPIGACIVPSSAEPAADQRVVWIGVGGVMRTAIVRSDGIKLREAQFTLPTMSASVAFPRIVPRTYPHMLILTDLVFHRDPRDWNSATVLLTLPETLAMADNTDMGVVHGAR